MTKRTGHKVSSSRSIPASKQNTTSNTSRSSQRVGINCSTASSQALDSTSDEHEHGDSTTALTGQGPGSDAVRVISCSTRTRSHSGQRSWLATLAALLTVHAVLLIAYGVHSKWQWATELADILATITCVLPHFYTLVDLVIIWIINSCLVDWLTDYCSYFFIPSTSLCSQSSWFTSSYAHITSSQSPSLLSPSITPPVFHSRLKTYLFHKSFSP